MFLLCFQQICFTFADVQLNNVTNNHAVFMTWRSSWICNNHYTYPFNYRSFPDFFKPLQSFPTSPQVYHLSPGLLCWHEQKRWYLSAEWKGGLFLEVQQPFIFEMATKCSFSKKQRCLRTSNSLPMFMELSGPFFCFCFIQTHYKPESQGDSPITSWQLR